MALAIMELFLRVFVLFSADAGLFGAPNVFFHSTSFSIVCGSMGKLKIHYITSR
jgi:hypothetical protein